MSSTDEGRRKPSFEEMLRDPNEQFDLRSELLASIDRYMNAPSATMSVPASARPVTVSPARTGGISACPSRVTAVLGFDKPTAIPCGLLAGHIGAHRYEIVWQDDGHPESTGTPHPYDLDAPYIGDGAPNVRSLRERLDGAR